MKHLVIGLGSIGKRHAQHLVDQGHNIAGVDPYATAHFDFPLFDSLESAWRFEPDMVWICSPTCLHAQQAIEALGRGVHLFVEKPVAHNLEAALTIKDVWANMSQKRLIWVGCNMRFHPAVVRLKKAIDDGLIGRPLICRIHFSHYLPNMRPGTDYRQTYAAQANQGGGVILDDIHDIDLALWLAGSAKRLVGLAASSGLLEMDVEDVAHVSLLHESGAFSEIHMDFLRRDKSRGIEVIGDGGTLEWRSMGKNPERATLKFVSAQNGKAHKLWQKELNSPHAMFAQQFEAVMEALSHPAAYCTAFDQALEALRIAMEVKASYETPP